MYDDIDFNKLFNNINNDYDSSRIVEVEKTIGHKLPVSYLEFLNVQNGGIIDSNYNDCWLTSIYGISLDCDGYSEIENEYKILIDESDFFSNYVPIGDTKSAGHDMYFLDYTNQDNNEPKIVRIDIEMDKEKYFVADNFKDFIYMIYNKENIEGNLIDDNKVNNKLNGLDGIISVCKGCLFIDLIILIVSFFKHSYVIVGICIFILIIIIPLWIIYEKKYNNVKNNKN